MMDGPKIIDALNDVTVTQKKYPAYHFS